jgi:hypothetical protein
MLEAFVDIKYGPLLCINSVRLVSIQSKNFINGIYIIRTNSDMQDRPPSEICQMEDVMYTVLVNQAILKKPVVSDISNVVDVSQSELNNLTVTYV